MAMGIPAQPGPFRRCSSSHPRLLSSPLCRSLSGTAWTVRRPFWRSNRQEFRSHQRLGSSSSGIDSYDSLKGMQSSGMTTRPAEMPRGMHIIHHARLCSSQTSSLKFATSRNLINMPSTGEESKPIFGSCLYPQIKKYNESDWEKEGLRLKLKRMTEQVRENIANGQITFHAPENGYRTVKEKDDFWTVRDGSAYEGAVSSFINKPVVNEIKSPQPAWNQRRHGQSESTKKQAVKEGIRPNGSLSSNPSGDITVRGTNSDFVGASHVTHVKVTANNIHVSNSSIKAVSSFINETVVNEIKSPQPAWNQSRHMQSELTKSQTVREGICPNGSLLSKPSADITVKGTVFDLVGTSHGKGTANDTHVSNSSINDHLPRSPIEKTATVEECGVHKEEHQKKLARIYDKVHVVNNISTAKEVVQMLTTTYKDCIHACDTEVANIDVKQETPVGHGEIICFSIYSGPKADFGNGKSCIWVDVLDGGRGVLTAFALFFEDPSIKKVWHNYSFDSHVIENYGIKLSGFHADTMHLARLWDSSRRTDGGYSLEALTSDPRVMVPIKKKDQEVMPRTQSFPDDEVIVGKKSMKSIFGKKKVKKDGSEGKIVTVAPVELLQRGEERIQWICYSALDSINTLKLYNSLKENLISQEWVLEGDYKGTMYDFYEEYWRPFGVLLVQMESEGMLVDRAYLSGIEKVAIVEQQLASDIFRKWASKYCPDAKYMNVGSDTQLRQLFFGGIQNRRDYNEYLPLSKTFKVPNTENVIEMGKKTPSKYRTITLHNIVDNRDEDNDDRDKDNDNRGVHMQAEIYTPSGWPSLSGDALKTFAGKISTEQIFLMDYENGFQSDCSKETLPDQTNIEVEESEKLKASSDDTDTSTYGTAYHSFGGGEEGKEACHAIAALCEVCSIDSLISNFILPLQGNHISGKNGRIHCSLNINTETGRLSARRPNLQNQPALEKDRYKIRQAFIAAPGNSLIVADYGQLELRILAHLSSCKSMLEAFKAGGDFHSRTAMNMYSHVREAVDKKRVLLEWHPQPGEDKPPVPLLKDAFATERRKAKMLNFSIAYGKTPVGLSRDWKVSVKEARETVNLWYKNRREVLKWQQARKEEAREERRVYTLLGRARDFPSVAYASNGQKGHIERAAINAPVQGSAADVAMCAMLEIDRNSRLKELGWKLLLQVHDEVILEGPSESAETAKAIVVECMSKPFNGTNFLKVDLSVDAKCAQNWYTAK